MTEQSPKNVEPIRPQSLCQDRATPTSLSALKNFAPDHTEFQQAIDVIVRRGRECFPRNIFADYDYFASVLAETFIESSVLGQKMTETVLRLLHLFSAETTIRFAYLHDFLYGFDWAKWLRRNPEHTVHKLIGPFDQFFLDAMERRGHELLTLIEQDDDEYNRLNDDNPRNSFTFMRNPTSERMLLGELAQLDLIPVRAWLARNDEIPRYQKDYAAERRRVAKEMGLDITSCTP